MRKSVRGPVQLSGRVMPFVLRTPLRSSSRSVVGRWFGQKRSYANADKKVMSDRFRRDSGRLLLRPKRHMRRGDMGIRSQNRTSRTNSVRISYSSPWEKQDWQ